MEGLKELLSSKYFSSFGYIVALFHLPSLVIFGGYTGSLRTSERRTFSCPSSPDSRDDCLVKYDEHYNSPIPLYLFVLLCFLPPLAVCVAYSWCFVKSRVDEIEIALKPDPENPRPRPRRRTRRVFYSYFLHLFVRLVLGISFVVLQNFVFYPDGFPTEFACVSPTIKPTVSLNSTDFNVTKDDGLIIDCDNSVGSDNATCAMGIWAVNILFAIHLFGEMCYLSVRAVQSEGFTFDSEFCQRHLFNQRGTAVTLRETKFRMKRRVREETEFLEPLIAQQEIENKIRLDDIFVDLVIYTGRAVHEFTDLSKRHEIFDVYLKPKRGAIAIEKLEELLLPNTDTDDPRKILVFGRPGIGKSLLCTKLSRDWSNGDLLRDNFDKSFEHFFLCQFRWFNSETSTNISLKDLLSRLVSEGSIDNDVLQDMLDNPHKVLLIFDGLDEFKYHESCLEDERAQGGNSPTEKMPFSALYVKLIKEKQLPGATILTTCRPNVVQSLAGLRFNRIVEVMGFTPEKVQEYVHNFFTHDPETMNRIWGHISSSAELLSLCYIPVNSFIVCSILEELIKLQDEGSALPTTSTEIYSGAFRLFIFKHHPEFKGKQLTEDYLAGNVGFPDSVEETLSQVESLAKTGIEERRLVFDSAEVKGMEDCGLFHRMPNCKSTLLEPRPDHFCFIHLTLQELLAAIEIAKMESSDIIDFITSNVSDPKWHLVIQFVAGLLHGQDNEATNSYISLLCGSLPVAETKQKALLLIKCLHECKDKTIMQKAASELQKNSKFGNRIDLSDSQVTPADCTAIVHFITHLQEHFELGLQGNNIRDQGLAPLCDALKEENCKLTKLDLGGTNITDQGVSHLCDALKNGNCKLEELVLFGNQTTDLGVAHLCDALKDENCKLTKLDLRHNDITHQSVSHLCDALKDGNCKLAMLDLGSNKITDQGVSLLCDALKDGNCKLPELYLGSNKITDQGVSELCDALKDGNCKLIKLHLEDNKITEQGALHLCDALKDGNCKLTKLYLGNNDMKDQGVSHLCDALKDGNCKLTNLDLGCNHITDQGVSHLCYALKDGNCKLTKLYLGNNYITDQGVSHLCYALKDGNCKLTKLDLGDNKITDHGVSHLCDALKDGNCKLTELDLVGTNITDQGVSHLRDALKDGNYKLKFYRPW